MIRVPVPAGALRPGPLTLSAEESHRVRTVLRLSPGDALELFDGAGQRARARVSAVASEVVVEVLEVQAAQAAPAVTIAQALAKADKVELVIQKATELGAAGVVPFRAARSVVRLEGAKAEERVERWRKIAREAARQCGRADTPEVTEVQDLPAVLARAGRVGLLYEGATDLRLGAFLDLAAGAPVTLVIGPEGGFAEEEIARARAAGAAIVGLGPRILRTETVALAALAVALHRAGELG